MLSQINQMFYGKTTPHLSNILTDNMSLSLIPFIDDNNNDDNEEEEEVDELESEDELENEDEDEDELENEDEDEMEIEDNKKDIVETTDIHANEFDGIEIKTPSGQTIYGNQIVAGKQIMNFFMGCVRAVILYAEMQCGKTGVALITTMESIEKLGVDKVFFICGMADNSIKSQAMNRFAGLKNVEICFNPDLQKYVNNKIRLNNQKILVIVDESQYGSCKDGFVQKFLIEVIGVDPAIESSRWTNKNAYYLSVSATPFTEEASNTLFKPGKGIVKLLPGKGYIGVKKLLNNGNIKESFQLKNDDDYEKLALEMGQLPYESGYYIIRLNCEAYNSSCENYFRSTRNFTKENFINMHCKNESVTMNINDYLDVKPDRPIIIFVYKSLSASYTPHLDYVKIMFEAPGDKNECTLQRFIGRACGFHKTPSPMVYTSIDQVKQYINYVDNNVYPDNCKDVHRTVKKYQGIEQVPILIDVSHLMVRFETKKNQLKRFLPEIFRDQQVIEQVSKQDNSEQKMEILGDKYRTMGTSTVASNKHGLRNTIGPWWDTCIKNISEQKPCYKSHKETKNEDGEIILHPNQKYIYLQGMKSQPFYGYLIITSMRDCCEREIPYDVSTRSMYHFKSSYVAKKFIKKKVDECDSKAKCKLIIKETILDGIKTKKMTIVLKEKIKIISKEEINSTKKIKINKKTLIPQKIRIEVWNHWIGAHIGETLCPLCQKSKMQQGGCNEWHCGHIIPESKGGKIGIDNLRVICPGCNSSMGTRLMKDFCEGYINIYPGSIQRLQL